MAPGEGEAQEETVWGWDPACLSTPGPGMRGDDAAAPCHSTLAQNPHTATPPSTTFSLNGVVYTAPDPTQQLASFLREKTRVTSVKVGCAEGGCGACAVLVRRPDASGGPPRIATVNACLTPVGALHGASLLASDGLGTGAKPHAVHEALAVNHASQCGFCTPGMAVACAAAAANRSAATCGGGDGAACAVPAVGGSDTIARSLDGNLCRCTGYASILKAAYSLTPADVEDLGGKLVPPPAVRAAASDARASLAVSATGSAWLTPTTVQGVVDALSSATQVRIVAGNTGSGVYKKALWPPPPLHHARLRVARG